MPASIVALISDLYFATKVEETAHRLGILLILASSAEIFQEAVRKNQPRVVVIDLNQNATERVANVRFARKLSSESQARIICFYSHVQTELAQSALAAGADRVIPRSFFSTHLSEILQGNLD